MAKTCNILEYGIVLRKFSLKWKIRAILPNFRITLSKLTALFKTKWLKSNLITFEILNPTIEYWILSIFTVTREVQRTSFKVQTMEIDKNIMNEKMLTALHYTNNWGSVYSSITYPLSKVNE